LPAIVDVEVLVALGEQSTADELVCSFFDDFLAYIATVVVPAVPAHGWSPT